MFSFLAVNPDWYNTYWYSDRPHREGKAFTRILARVTIATLLLVSSGVVVSHF